MDTKQKSIKNKLRDALGLVQGLPVAMIYYESETQFEFLALLPQIAEAYYKLLIVPATPTAEKQLQTIVNGFLQQTGSLISDWSFAEAADTILPGLSSAVEFSEASTPLTYETWGGGSEGACAGWSWDESDEMGSKLKSLIRTPIPNLYMVGYQAFSQLFMGGFATAMHSGNVVAEMILEEK